MTHSVNNGCDLNCPSLTIQDKQKGVCPWCLKYHCFEHYIYTVSNNTGIAIDKIQEILKLFVDITDKKEKHYHSLREHSLNNIFSYLEID